MTETQLLEISNFFPKCFLNLTGNLVFYILSPYMALIKNILLTSIIEPIFCTFSMYL